MRELIGARLKEERERLDYNQIDFAAAGGASNRSQVDWEKGKQVPNAEFLASVAAIGVDVQYVLTSQRSANALAPDEQELLTGYRSLDIRGKAGVLGMIDGMSEPKKLSSSSAFVVHGKVGQQITGDITAPQTIQMGGVKKAKKSKKNLDK